MPLAASLLHRRLGGVVNLDDILAFFQEGRLLEASVLVPHEAPIRARPIALGEAGFELGVPSHVTLPVGERVRLELVVEGARAAVVRAAVAGRDDMPGERRYHFR